MKAKLFSKFLNSHWDLAFLREDIENVVNGCPVHFQKINNPYSKAGWFADPFILDVSDSEVILLAEQMRTGTHKGVIAKITIDRKKNLITHVETVLEEPWHLSFPFIVRQNGKVFVCPESARSGVLSMYEYIESDTNSKLIKVSTICEDTIWDPVVTREFGEPIILTARTNDFFLDTYKWANERSRFVYDYTISSKTRDMRMAGDLIRINNTVFCPSQISGANHYGKAVEIKSVELVDGKLTFEKRRVVKPPFGVLSDGLHTLNTYNGLAVVDIHYQDHVCGIILKNMAALKKIAIQKCRLLWNHK